MKHSHDRGNRRNLVHRSLRIFAVMAALVITPRYVTATGIVEIDPTPRRGQEVPLVTAQPAATVGRHIRLSIRLLHPERVRGDRVGYLAGIESLRTEVQSLSGVRYVESYWSLQSTAQSQADEPRDVDGSRTPSAHFDSADRSTTDLHVYLSAGTRPFEHAEVTDAVQAIVDRWTERFPGSAVGVLPSRLIVPAVGLVHFSATDQDRAVLNPSTDRLVVAVRLPHGQTAASAVGAELVLETADRLERLPGIARAGGAADALAPIAAGANSGDPNETRNWDAPYLAGLLLPDRSGAVLELTLQSGADLDALGHALHRLALELRRTGIVLSLFGIEHVPWHWDNELAFPHVRGTFVVSAEPTSHRATTSRVYGVDARTGNKTILTDFEAAARLGEPQLRDRWLTIHNVTNEAVEAIHLDTGERLTFVVPSRLSGYAFFPDTRSLVYSTWVQTDSSRTHYVSGVGTAFTGLQRGATPVVTNEGALAFVAGEMIHLIGADGSQEQLRLRTVTDRIVATPEGLVAMGALPARTITWIDHAGTRASEYRFDAGTAWNIYPLTKGAWIGTADRTVIIYDERVGMRTLETLVLSHDERVSGVSFAAEPAAE